MVSSLGVPVVLCAALGGETGDVLGHLLPADGITVRSMRVGSRNGAYVHDRRDGEREEVADAAGSPLDRHERDSLYELTLTEGLTHGRVLLSGPQDDRVLPTDLYRRLGGDLGANGCRVAADLAGDRLVAVLEGRPDLIKVSHEELLADKRAASEDAADLVTAMHTLRDDGAGTVIDSRAGAAPALASGRPIREALQVGAACGALNVVRHGLGTGGARAVETLAERVEIRPWTG